VQRAVVDIGHDTYGNNLIRGANPPLTMFFSILQHYTRNSRLGLSRERKCMYV